MITNKKYPPSLFPRGDEKARVVETAPGAGAKIVTIHLLRHPAWTIAQLWDELEREIKLEPGGNALHALAARLLAPITMAREVLVGQEGDHALARVQLQHVLTLDPEHPERAVILEAIAELTRWQADAAARVLARLEVHRG